jgi:hypothetical protein
MISWGFRVMITLLVVILSPPPTTS